jgi:uncharacterized protein (DUF1501 family)
VLNDPNAFSRRALLRHGLLMASTSLLLPSFLERSAFAMAHPHLSSIPGVPDERILVVLQLSGGNDGLNTIIPTFAPEYYKSRPAIAIQERDALRIQRSDGLALHPALAGLNDLYNDGLLGIVQGVGYPNPNRSHFKSMDIWQTADTSATGNGWLGRYLDSECCGFGKGESGTVEANASQSAGPPSISIGRSAPLALDGSKIKPVAFESAQLFRWSVQDSDKDLSQAYDTLNRRGIDAAGQQRDTNADFLLRTALDAQVSSDLIRKAVAKRPQTVFPQNELGNQLAMVSSMIGAGLKTRVYYVSHGSFDTHSGQGGPQGRHAQLLRAFADGVKAFWQEMKAQGNDQRVLMMSFSEFGRRVGQNASQGTDHGTAAPMFLMGPNAKPGVLSPHPSLRDLEDGDLKFNTDFRGVYASILEDWLKADSDKVLEGRFKPLKVVKA